MKNLLIVALAISLSSCATIFGGAKESEITVESNTSLTVELISHEGFKRKFTTPFTTTLNRKNTYRLKLVSDTYESEDIYIGKKIRGLAFINLIAPIPWIIDIATGNAWEHKVKYVYIDTNELEKLKSEFNSSKEDLIANINIRIEGKDTDKESGLIKAHRNIKFSKV